MATPQPALRTSTADHRHAVGQICPFCEQPIPNDRAEEIHAKFAFKQKQDEAAREARFQQQVAEARAQIEAAKKAEIDKVKADALAQENAARNEAKKAADAEAQEKLAALVARQQEDKLKLEEAEQRRIAAVNQYQALKEQTETIAAARAAEVRAALEKSNAEAVNLKDAQHAAAMQKLSEELKTMQRRVDAVEGEGADINLLDALKHQFPKDEITSVNKPNGANIIHVVKHNKKECGKIVYDSRNRNIWQTNFATKLRDDMVTEKAHHAILTTSKFPTGVRQIHLCDGIIAANPARAMVLADLFRDEIIRNHSQRVSEQDQSRKTAKLYTFITSDQFSNLLESLEGNDEKVLKLDEEHKRAYNAMWEKRRTLSTTTQRLHANLRIEIARIVGTDGTE